MGKTRTGGYAGRSSWKHPHGRGEDAPAARHPAAGAETPPRTWGRRADRRSPAGAAGNTPTDVGKTVLDSGALPADGKHPHGRGEDGGLGNGIGQLSETPPRTWGRPMRQPNTSRQLRNTPTDVGKTGRNCSRRLAVRKHPHGRGEDSGPTVSTQRLPETPPRTWGRQFDASEYDEPIGNTPTDVGKTGAVHGVALRRRKHPHGRGEDAILKSRQIGATETPPRTWGRLQEGILQGVDGGNTPTDVGKTFAKRAGLNVAKKHPHGRGEDIASETPVGRAAETPPRTWGRLRGGRLRLTWLRNTPTDVGKTARQCCRLDSLWKHPHGRGEDPSHASKPARSSETPPRTWGRPGTWATDEPRLRNTPTDVGKTKTSAATTIARKKHPHGRGEDRPCCDQRSGTPETPPRTWGRLFQGGDTAVDRGNTPTDVGKTWEVTDPPKAA